MEPHKRRMRLPYVKQPRMVPLLLLISLSLSGCGLGDGGTTEGRLRSGGTSNEATPDALETGDPDPTPEISPPPPESFEPFTFAALGDFGTGGREQKQIAERMCAWRESHPFDLVVTTGDNIYDAGEEENFQANFFDPYECLLSEGVRFRSTLGNHDVATKNGLPELEEPAFGMLARNYVVSRAGIRFVFANSNNLDVEWLKDAITPRPDEAWTIVSFHHPVFSGGKEHGPTAGFADTLPRLFARKGVDLVLTGHDHVYSVTREVRGIRYVVTGGGGARIYGCQDSVNIVRCIPDFHFLSVTVGPEDITVKAIPRSGRALHRFTTDGT